MPRKAVIVIPAFDPPPEKLEGLLGELYRREPDCRILLFNDGSRKEIGDLLEGLPQKFPSLLLLSRRENLGKGRTLAESFSHVLKNFPSSPIVTADSDGQHSAEDILLLASLMEEGNEDLLLGVRDFSTPHIPRCSRWGNILTRKIFSLLSGVKLQDTQTGLRGFSPAFARHILENCRSNHYEFEMDCLWEAVRKGIRIRQQKIATLYPDPANSGSHFRKCRDSFLICKRLFVDFLKK